MQRRIAALEEISLLATQALVEFDVSMRRAEASIRRQQELNQRVDESIRRLEEWNEPTESIRRLEESNQGLNASVEELSAAVRRSEATVQALVEFVPVIQAEVIRLDDRIDRVEGA